MIRFIALLYIISISTTYAGDKIFFLSLPTGITPTEAMIAIGYTAKNRKYTVSEITDESLTISLSHRGYDVALIFSVSEHNIYYKDLTKNKNFDDDDEDDENTSSSTSNGTIPPSWLKMLKSNTKIVFPLIEKLKANLNMKSPG